MLAQRPPAEDGQAAQRARNTASAAGPTGEQATLAATPDTLVKPPDAGGASQAVANQETGMRPMPAASPPADLGAGEPAASPDVGMQIDLIA